MTRVTAQVCVCVCVLWISRVHDLHGGFKDKGLIIHHQNKPSSLERADLKTRKTHEPSGSCVATLLPISYENVCGLPLEFP